MNLVVGGAVLVMTAGLVAVLVGVATDKDGLFVGGLAALVAPIVLGMVVFGVAIAAGAPDGPRVIEGACYRAVRTSTTTLVPAGKVLIPTTTSSVSLDEIRCPSW